MGCLLGGIVATVLEAAGKIIAFVLVRAAKAIRIFGLYVPIAYLLYGAVLYLVFDFGLFVKSVDGGLYSLGFALSLLCSVIITVRHLIVKPLREHFGGEVIEYESKRRSKHTPEAPKIYRSRVNPGIIVYEYANRYDLYEKRGDGLTHVKTEWKKDRR